MKKLLFVLFCLALMVILQLSVTAALPPEAEEENSGIEAILEPLWTVPYTATTTSIAWGDMDNDGDLDLAVGNSGQSNWVFRNDGGEFTRIWQSSEADDTRSVAWGDWDSDGCLDLAVGNYGLNGQANRVYRNVSSGGHCLGLPTSATWSSSEVDQTTSVAWGDWNGDGALDLAVGNFGDPNRVYCNEGGYFGAACWSAPTGQSTRSVAWGDWDNDGVLELAVGNLGENRVYENTGTGNLTLAWQSAVNDDTWSVAWGDVNGDGYLDLVAGNANAPAGQPNYLYLNNGAAPYLPTNPSWTSTENDVTYSVAWGDWDGDGDLDLAVGNGPSSGPNNAANRAYRNDGGALTLAWTANNEKNESTWAVAWGDADGDGDLELFAGNDSGYLNQRSRLYGNQNGVFERSDIAWDTSPSLTSYNMAWGDWDGDGDMDLAIGTSGYSYVYQNDGGVLTLAWTSPFQEDTRSVAWGDWDGDGDLDLAVGNHGSGLPQANRVYENVGGNLVLAWVSADSRRTAAVAWGDWDGDGDLDLVAANTASTGAPNVLYENTGGNPPLNTVPVWQSSESDASQAIAWGDWDNDSDLDLAVANSTGPNRIYENQDNVLIPVLDFGSADDSWSLAWGDMDGDGDLDLAVGNYNQPNRIYENISNTLILTLTTTEADNTRSVAWGDVDGDGDLDLAVANAGNQANRIYLNVDGRLGTSAAWSSTDVSDSRCVAWGDVDGDGDLDLVTANYNQLNRLYYNARISPPRLPNDPSYVWINRPGFTDDAAYFSVREIHVFQAIPISYTLFDDESDPVLRIEPQVSWDGGGQWFPATAAGGDGTTDLATSPNGTPHLFVWDAMHDMIRDGYLNPLIYKESRQDDVAFRILVYPQMLHAGLFQRPAAGSETYLFRVDIHPDWRQSFKVITPTLVIPGEWVTYTIVFTNTDLGRPPGMITDALPAGLELVGTPWASHPQLDYSYASNRITWTESITFNVPVTIEFNAQLNLPMTDDLVIENCAWLWDGLHPAFERCITFTVVSTPDLSTSWKLVNGLPFNTARPGDPLTYTLVLTNVGTDNARGAMLADTLPPDLVWANHLTATTGTVGYAGGMVTWQGDVNAFEPVTITFQVTVAKPLPGGTFVTNTAWLNDGVNPPFAISPPVTTTIIAPDLRLSSKTAFTDQVEMGDALTYTIVLTNVGSLDANLVALLDPIPPNAAYIPGSFWRSSGVGGYDPTRDAITWTGAVSVGVPVTIAFAVTVGCPPDPQHPVLTNTAYIEEEMGGLVTLEATTSIWLPNLASSVKQVSPTQAAVGDLLTYTVILRNTGGYAPRAWLHDVLPIKVNGTGFCTASSGTVSCNAREVRWEGALDTGDEVTVTYTAVVNHNLPAHEIVNTVEIGNGCTTLTRSAMVQLAPLTYLPLIVK